MFTAVLALAGVGQALPFSQWLRFGKRQVESQMNDGITCGSTDDATIANVLRS